MPALLDSGSLGGLRAGSSGDQWHQCESLEFVGVSGPRRTTLDSGWVPKKSGLSLAIYRATPPPHTLLARKDPRSASPARLALRLANLVESVSAKSVCKTLIYMFLSLAQGYLRVLSTRSATLDYVCYCCIYDRS